MIDQFVIFSVDTSKVLCPAKGIWDGTVSWPFQIALSFVKLPPKEESIELSCIENKLKLHTLKVSARRGF